MDVPAHEGGPCELPALELYIAGAWREGNGQRTFDVVNPATEEVIGQLRGGGKSDIEAAIAAARAMFPVWRDTPPAERTRLLSRAVALIRENIRELAWLTSLELGMPVRDATVLAERAAEVLEWDAHEGRRLYARGIPSGPTLVQTVEREPYGAVAAFSPWNGSVFTPCRKIGSALAAGCTLVLKAAEETPMSVIALVRLFERAGIPAGVLNLVFGDPAEVSETLLRSADIRMISFTGSIPVGMHLARGAAASMKPCVMELGGHAPVVVCADADLDLAAQRLVAAKYVSGGQVCLAPSRVLVDASVCDAFTTRVVERVRMLRVGDGQRDDVDMGPLANRRRLEAVDALVHDAVAHGAELLCGGSRCSTRGFFYAPTVLGNVAPESRVMREEPFGPVLTISRYRTVDEAIALANALPLGLAAFVFSRSSAVAHTLTRRLECGTVGVNHFGVSTHGVPFGGVKHSGYGREGGTEGVLGYTYAKTVSQLLA